MGRNYDDNYWREYGKARDDYYYDLNESNDHDYYELNEDDRKLSEYDGYGEYDDYDYDRDYDGYPPSASMTDTEKIYARVDRATKELRKAKSILDQMYSDKSDYKLTDEQRDNDEELRQELKRNYY